MKGRFSRATGLVSLIGLMAGCGASDDKTPPAAAPAAAARSDAPQTASAPRSESKSTVSTPKPQSDPGAATPTEALSEFLAAARKGDVSRMSAFLAPPMDSLTLERAQLGSDILAAHEKLLNELDAAFGPRTDQSKRPFGSELAERVLGSYSADSFATAAGKLGNPRVVDQREEPGRVLLTVEVTPTGKQEPIRLKWAAIKAEQGWQVAPADFDIARSKSELASRRALLDTYRTAAREVHEGQYKNRQQVDRVMTWNLVHSQPMFAMGQPPQEVMEIVASPPEPAGKGDALWILIRSWPGESNQAPTVEFRTVSGDGPRWEGRLDELTAKLKQLHSDLAGRTQPVWVVNSDRPWTGPVRDVLKSLLDAGFDYRRVMFDMEEPQFRELEGQFTGRLRLFSLRSPAARTKAAVPIPDQPLEAHPDETPKTKTSVFDKSGPDLPDPTKIDGPVSKSLPPLNGPPTNDRKKSP